ncbi:cytosolic sulfotransferase 5-like [Phragmites australis]|uniref:cytosolic sulfotransferase 5-like n=1 Tax=Phragmites australis TaxID=29695 RepID=UPI002D766A43|nr:cytosolic sulfotransferase 5-like [Phragmites australis]
MAAAAAATPSQSGPVPFKDVDDGSVPKHTPKEEFGDLVSALPRRQQSILQLRLYQGFWLPAHWVPGTVVFQRRFAPRPNDVVLASYPKCGITWLKALAFAAAARGTYPPASEEHPLRRLNPHDCIPFIDEIFTTGEETKLDMLPSPRLMNTHLPYTLLPEPVTAGGCKVVYICRDPKDMVVSLWHFLRRAQPDLSFADTFESVCDGTVLVGPVWDHVLSYWRASVTHQDRVLFLKYEDMLRDTGANVRRLAKFMGQPFSAAEEGVGAVASIVELCSFDKMKGLEVNKAGTMGAYFTMPRDAFFRKGVAGDWANHMTPAMVTRLDEIVREKFSGTGLTFT